MMRTIYTIFICLIFASPATIAQQYDNLKEEIDKIIYYDTEITPEKNPGYIIGIIVGDSTFTFSYGSTNKDSLLPPSDSSLFEIGGLTKVFTATLLQVLVSEKLIHLDSTLNHYLPEEFQNSQCKKISIRQLMTHHSGLPKMPLEFGSLETDSNNPYLNYSPNDLLHFYSNYRCTGTGENYLYSNLGYALLEVAIESVTGLTFEEALIEKVLTPLEMHDTRVSLTDMHLGRIAQGYAIGGKPIAGWDFNSFSASEGLKSTAKDLLHFIHYNLGNYEHSEWNSIFPLMHQPQYPTRMSKDSYIASGWHVIKNKKYFDLVVHSGATSGYLAFAGFIRESETAVVILSNSEYGMSGLGHLILRMLNYNWKKKK